MTLSYLQEELKDAMKTGNTLKRDMLRGVIAAIKKVAIDERCEADEAMIDRVLLKEAKTLQEQIDTCPDTHQELKNEYIRRSAYLSAYLPQLMDDPGEIMAIALARLAEEDVEPVKALRSQIMKILMPHFKGKADMKIVNQVIGEMLV
jgi:uncharacterized protein YqeY